MLIKPLFTAALESALNRYLSLDDHIDDYLAGLSGKVIALRIDSPATTLYLCPAADRIQILENFEGQADAELSGSLAALGFMGLSATPMRSLYKGEVRMAGDVQLAGKLQRLFSKLDINLEGKLARYTGQAFAARLGNLFRDGRDWTRHSLESFRLNLEEFLQEETRDLPAKPEAELLFQQIDDLRNDSVRLDARIERLTATLAPIKAPQDR